MTILVGIPRNDYFTIPSKFSESFIYALDFTKQKYGIKNVGFVFGESTVISYNRNFLIKEARRINADIFVMIDSDMVFQKDSIVKLIESLGDADMVCGLFFNGAPPYHPSIYLKGKEAFKPYEKYPKDSLFEVDSAGMAFNAFGRKAIYGMETEPFNNIMKNGLTYGEDMSFCMRAKERGMKLMCDSRIKVGHLRMGNVNENSRDLSGWI